MTWEAIEHRCGIGNKGSDKMKTQVNQYKVRASHPTFGTGSFMITVKTVTCPHQYGGNTYRFASGDELGCSRDYFTKTDNDAITTFLSEHGRQVVSVHKIAG